MEAAWTAPASTIERAPLAAPLSPTQWVVTMLLGVGYTYARIGQELDMTKENARFHAVEAARKIPGDLPAQTKCALWARGASAEVLTGEPLLQEIVRKAGAFAAGSRAQRISRSSRGAHRVGVRASPSTPKFAGDPSTV